MEIVKVADILDANGLNEPVLNALLPNVDNYTALLMQPKGHIEASPAGVRNADRDLAKRQFAQLLNNAIEVQADLVVTPEYSMPWDTLIGSVTAGAIPAQGQLWALGCESIRYSELQALKQILAPSAILLYEELEPNHSRFVDPLAYVFPAPSADRNGEQKLIILVQFKTYPMGDPDHFEVEGMQRGSSIYQFGTQGSLKLASLICSDAFAFEDNHAKAIYDRCLVIHIQLNPKPRHEQFLGCRQRLFASHGDATEVLCLNWAENVEMLLGGQVKSWKNIGGSAWYLRPDKFDNRKTTLCANHQKGLYYTWAGTLHAHALFFNYRPATYLLRATKVDHVGVHGALSRRRGPQLIETCTWNDTNGIWEEQQAVDDGFAAVVGESDQAADEIRRIAGNDPFEAERVLALCAGKIDNGHQRLWYDLEQLDSCVIEASEVIRRLTFCQDPDQHASESRISRLRRCGRLWEILHKNDLLPPSLADLADGFTFAWSLSSPHQNVLSSAGKCATALYMGEDSNVTHIEATAKKLAEYLHRGTSDIYESLCAKQRLAVYYRQGDEIVLYDPHRYVKIDQTGEVSEFDIGREM